MPPQQTPLEQISSSGTDHAREQKTIFSTMRGL
jgi:hypothetical protein